MQQKEITLTKNKDTKKATTQNDWDPSSGNASAFRVQCKYKSPCENFDKKTRYLCQLVLKEAERQITKIEIISGVIAGVFAPSQLLIFFRNKIHKPKKM